MRHYIMNLRRSLRAGEDSRVYNYTQREIAKNVFSGVAGDTIDMMYNTRYYHDSDEQIRYVHDLIYNGTPMYINRVMIAPFEHEPYEDITGALREVTYGAGQA